MANKSRARPSWVNRIPTISREIVDFPGYRIGRDGSVWSCWQYNGKQPRKMGTAWRRLVGSRQRHRYTSVVLYCNGIASTHLVHSLVLAAFVGPRPPDAQACHNDGDGSNNDVSNLRWDSVANNQKDRLKHGTSPRGNGCGKAILTEATVIEIKALIAEGLQKKKIAQRYEVSPSTISAIASGANWGWLQ